MYEASELRAITEEVNEKSRQQAQKNAVDYANNVLASKLKATARAGRSYYHISIPSLPCSVCELTKYLKQHGYTIDFDMGCAYIEVSW